MRDVYAKKSVDFDRLARKYPHFRRHCFLTTSGKIRPNFKSDEFVRELAVALLREDFGLDVRLPAGNLAPRIPQRFNYVRLIASLLEANGIDGQHTIGVDVGTGASCIYPLLGAKEGGWTFWATESNGESAESAAENVRRNGLDERIRVLKVDGGSFFADVFGQEFAQISFLMCNPPFFADSEAEKKFPPSCSGERLNIADGRSGPAHSRTIARGHELATGGGEAEFVGRMIDESAEFPARIKIFSSMLGKKSSLRPLKSRLLERGVANSAVHVLEQGRTHRWVLVWSFDSAIRLKLTPPTGLAAAPNSRAERRKRKREAPFEECDP